jgi:hypothetical protein
VLTPFDDYPIHQTPQPIAHPASGDRNFYDRYFFNGFDSSGEWYFGLAMGFYPNRGVADAAFSVQRSGIQRSAFASARAPRDRAQTRVGPISIEIIEPLRVNHIRVEATHLGVEADLTWTARTAAVEEPRQTLVGGTATIMDVTRLVQWGTWSGSIETEVGRINADGVGSLGTKDRSWGIRPVGEPLPGAPSSAWAGGGLFELWAPVHFERDCTHLVLFEHPDGTPWFWSGFKVPTLGPGEPAWGSEDAVLHARWCDHRVDFRPGTRRSRAASLEFEYRDGTTEELSFEPVLDFPLKGLGYWHPDWGHGFWRDEAIEGSDEWRVDDLDPLEFSNLHVQQLCHVHRGDERGLGVLEQFVFGPHEPSGFRDFADGAG